MIKETENILQAFETITLNEMDSVKLMDRTDTKYNFSIKDLPSILSQCVTTYKVLEISTLKLCHYKTLYYDTPSFALYKEHHQGKLNRYKIRHRLYQVSNIGFLEVKHKTNKGRTIKKRISKNSILNSWDNDASIFLKKQLPFDFTNLQPVVWINYERITLVNNVSKERVTLDLNLTFDKNGIQKTFSNLVIAEIKQDSKVISPFVELMKTKHIQEGGLSKYCTAIACMHNIKQNNFKEKIIKITKIQNQ